MTPLKVQKVLGDFGGRWIATGLGTLGMVMTAGIVPVESLVRIIRAELDHHASANPVPENITEV